MKALGMLSFGLLALSLAVAEEPGIVIEPDESGAFVFEDDFTTPRFLAEAFLENTGAEIWEQGALVSSGPNRHRKVTYRFHGTHSITNLDVTVQHHTNGKNLGGHTTLLLSANGLDWITASTSGTQEPNSTGWHDQPLSVSEETARGFAGGTELWVRIILDNNCGLKTGTSNLVESLRVALTLGGEAAAQADPQSELVAAWGAARRDSKWQTLTLDWADGSGQHAPHYYEDADGWLQAPGANPLLSPDEAQGFPISRTYRDDTRAPLSLAAFIETSDAPGPVIARLTVSGNKDSHRVLNVLWDDNVVAAFDAATFFEQDQHFFVRLATDCGAGIHELRIAGADPASALIRQVALNGASVLGWAEKPPLPPGGALSVLSAYYLPDPAPPAASQAVEGRRRTGAIELTGLTFKGMQRLYREHADFGAVRVVVKNTSGTPVRIADTILLNGAPIEESYVDFTTSPWDAPGVVWYRMRPRSLEPGACGQLYIRFRKHPEGETATITIPMENGVSAEVAIPYRDPGVTIDYVTLGPDGVTLYVYARKTSEETADVQSIWLDGVRIENAGIYGADYPGGVALAVAKLDAPLSNGEYHVAGVAAKDGTRVDAQFRVLPFFFARSSIHVPIALCKDMHMNLATWHMHSEEECREYGIPTTAMHSCVTSLHSQAPIIFAPDEPDAKDNRGGGYDKGLGWHARLLSHAGWQELAERCDPPAASWNNMDGTVRPLNWAVYGQFGDLNGFDPYPVTYYGADHAYVRESLSFVRQCGAPTPLYAILECYGWSKGQGVPSKARGPLPEEYRQNIVQSIGAGMKGLSSWVYAACAGGWQLNDEFAQEITKMNQLIEHIEGDLLLGVPVDLVSCDTEEAPTGIVGNEHWPKPRVWAGSLLCGPHTVVIVAVNHIPASKPGPPEIDPTQNVRIECRLPDFMGDAVVTEVTEDGLQPFPCSQNEETAVFELDSIRSGRVFRLRAPGESG